MVVRPDRWHRFVISRVLDPRGLYVYKLENTAKKETLAVPLELFDRFRTLIAALGPELETTQEDRHRAELRFGGRTQFLTRWNRTQPDEVTIRSFGPDEVPNSELTVARRVLPILADALHHPKLGHRNDLLVRIVTYHRLFAATFVESTVSVTSNLQLRKNLLSHVERYVPALGRRATGSQSQPPLIEPAMLEMLAPAVPEGRSRRTFRSRLGERDEDKRYQVDYESLFANSPKNGHKKRSRPADFTRNILTDEAVDYFSVPLLASDVKQFAKVPFRCELSRSDVKQLRFNFLDDWDTTFHMGFEIFDCIFDKRGKLNTYRFPLYYFPVRIVESGREVILHPLEGERVYLNHFALANLVESYSPAGQATKRVETFLRALLSHQFTARGAADRIRVTRMLPHSSQVFEQTREILLGLPGERGKGGLLSDVKVQAIECDLESVFLYKAPQSSSPITRALDDDLAQILTTAAHEPDRFDASLLGRSLSPHAAATEAEDVFSRTPSMHGAQARSIRNLVERLNDHDLVLLEGPPGTGKTYNIANLVIHCVATGKRLLVVSDQEAAIHALAEQIQRYVVGKNRQSPEGRELEQRWRMGIKVVDELPTGAGTLSTWSRQVRRMLGVDASKELEWPSGVPHYEEEVGRIDRKIREIAEGIAEVMRRRFGKDTPWTMPTVAQKSEHPTTPAAVASTLEAARRLTSHREPLALPPRYTAHRERLLELGLHDSYDLFDLKGRPEIATRRLEDIQTWLRRLAEEAPLRAEEFDRIEAPDAARPMQAVLRERWLEAFPREQGWTARAATFVRALWGQHDLHRLVMELAAMVKDQLALWARKDALDALDEEAWEGLSRLHLALAPSGRRPLDVRLELWLAAAESSSAAESVQESLERVATLQRERDALVRRQFLYGLGTVGQRAFAASKGGGTNRLTSILATLDRLESATSWARATDVVHELQEQLFDVFPVWICRKQAVPFLLPCRERTFDLVIVDEATQCRVDDAIPLLYRGRKLMAVGDERQTVLAKNSSIDDYLFDDFELDEHLRFAQARGMKGGGSHLFGLVKRIKQASVMLDEHYRCPPDIIEFSNRYVYENQLRTMQWKMRGAPPPVVVDHSEARIESSERDQTGRFKGIETGMIDRFFAYVARTLRRIERETAEKIDPETDVALVYFLLKNEAYIKAAKGDLLKRLPRGSDVLDGAGAALQGKERNYIFYLWDVTRYNMANFRQGDDESKRKGELNVLMSRPKRRAYHFLHRDFDKLKHTSNSITEYLWLTYQRRRRSRTKESPNGPGLLIRRLLEDALGPQENPAEEDIQLDVTLGNPMLGVDLMWLPPEGHRTEEASIGVVDLSAFAEAKDPGQEVVDYFFQLQRASPRVVPVFGFVHELARPASFVMARLRALSQGR